MSERLVARGLWKRYGDTEVVRDVTLEVDGAEVVGLLGPNGAGKTTTFNMIAGSVRPTRGEVFLGDREITEMQPRADRKTQQEPDDQQDGPKCCCGQDGDAEQSRVSQDDFIDIDTVVGDWDGRTRLHPSPPETSCFGKS